MTKGVLYMEKIGIICEYNPFHNGHMYHIQKIKEMYPDSFLVLILNGYFLERGEVSILTKEDKTKIALFYGIDLVIELPTLYGTQSADIFADISVTLLHHLKVEKLIFGSELNDISLLNKIVEEVECPTYQETVQKFLKEGINYPTALSKAISLNIDFNNPNDLLAISYIKAIKKHKYSITPLSIKRTSHYHDLKSTEEIISASNIRNKLFHQEEITNYLPEISHKSIIPNNDKTFFTLLKFKILTNPHLEEFLTVDEGIENRLVKCVKTSNSLEEFFKKVKTKRYTMNKLRRMCIHILLGITKKENTKTLSYIHILGFNKKGQAYLNSIKKEIDIPTQINKNSIEYKTEIKAAILYDLLHNTNTYKFEMQNKPIQKL